MKSQIIMSDRDNYIELDNYLNDKGIRNIFLVCGKSLSRFKINDYFNDLKKNKDINIHIFDDIRPNPLFYKAIEAIDIYKENNCDCIIAVGGGSVMDSAKCVKMFMNAKKGSDYLKQEIIPNDIPFIAIPTTAGTGSEATRFAIVYVDGEKVTVSDDSCIPDVVLFDPETLNTLNDYQRKSTMMDALSHAIESMWAVKANDESMGYALEAIKMITDNVDDYLNNESKANENMLKAAYIAGKAINITQTTAGHAMCYKLTSLYGLAHGHSVSLVMSKLFPYVLKHLDDFNDPIGKDHLIEALNKIAAAMSLNSPEQACEYYVDLVERLELKAPEMEGNDFSKLINSINPDRLNNNPVKLDSNTIEYLYREIFNKLENYK